MITGRGFYGQGNLERWGNSRKSEYHYGWGQLLLSSAGCQEKVLVASDYRSTCPWKGEAYYYDILVNGEKNENAAWYYPQPKEKALQIKDYVAFWKGVTIEE